MENCKEILILTPIGRIKWLKAPDSLSEIIFHLSRTFNAPELSISLNHIELGTMVCEDNYLKIMNAENDAVFNMSIDLIMKNMIESSGAKFDEKVEPEKPPVSYDDRKIGQPRPPARERSIKEIDPAERAKYEPIARGESRAVRGKKGGAAKTVNSEEEAKIAEGLKTLRDCGFTDTNKARLALIKAKFNVEEAVDLLISG